MKTVIEMAREADIEWDLIDEDEGQIWYITKAGLERLVELARADEREKYKWDVHSCGPTCTKVACVAMREAVEAEREACAKVCDAMEEKAEGTECCKWPTPIDCAHAIRARGNT